MNEIIIKIEIIIGIMGVATLTAELVAMPLYITVFGCSDGRPFTEVWIDYQKHNLRVLRRLFINDLTKCPRCGSLSVEHISGLYDNCLKCTYLEYDPEYEKALNSKNKSL